MKPRKLEVKRHFYKPKKIELSQEDISKGWKDQNGIWVKTLRTRKWPSYGFEVRAEIWKIPTDPKHPVEIRSCYTLDSGEYISDVSTTFSLVKKYGITKFETIDQDHSVCSIGFSNKKKKWYGWSHRAIHGFGVGDIVKKDSLGNPGKERKIEDIKDAKDSAISFALDVAHTILDPTRIILESENMAKALKKFPLGYDIKTYNGEKINDKDPTFFAVDVEEPEELEDDQKEKTLKESTANFDYQRYHFNEDQKNAEPGVVWSNGSVMYAKKNKIYIDKKIKVNGSLQDLIKIDSTRGHGLLYNSNIKKLAAQKEEEKTLEWKINFRGWTGDGVNALSIWEGLDLLDIQDIKRIYDMYIVNNLKDKFVFHYLTGVPTISSIYGGKWNNVVATKQNFMDIVLKIIKKEKLKKSKRNISNLKEEGRPDKFRSLSRSFDYKSNDCEIGIITSIGDLCYMNTNKQTIYDNKVINRRDEDDWYTHEEVIEDYLNGINNEKYKAQIVIQFRSWSGIALGLWTDIKQHDDKYLRILFEKWIQPRMENKFLFTYEYDNENKVKTIKVNKSSFLETIYNIKHDSDIVAENQIKGGKGDNTSKKDVDKKEFMVGRIVEREHTDNQKQAEEIALDHLTEKPDYYSRLYRAGLMDEPEAIKLAKYFWEEIKESTLQGIANHSISKNDIEHSFSNSSKYRRHPILQKQRKKVKNNKEKAEKSLVRALKIAKFRSKYNIEQDSAKNRIRESLEKYGVIE